MSKRKNNLIALLFGLIVGSSLLLLSPVNAVGLKDGFSVTGQLNNFAGSSGYTAPKDPEYYAGLVLNTLFAFLGTIAILLFFYSGFTWMTAKGNEAQVTKAKTNFINAIIGIIIITSSYALTIFVLKIFS